LNEPVSVIGRGDIIATTASRPSQRRLLTIIGLGSIGKTTVAVAFAEAKSPSYPAVGAILGMLPRRLRF
jgi:hypothetical protein